MKNRWLSLVFLLGLAGCGDGGASAAGRDRKEFRIIENQLKLRLQLHASYHESYPQELAELEEPGASGYKLPTVPRGYFLDYDRKRGIVNVRSEAGGAGDVSD